MYWSSSINQGYLYVSLHKPTASRTLKISPRPLSWPLTLALTFNFNLYLDFIADRKECMAMTEDSLCLPHVFSSLLQCLDITGKIFLFMLLAFIMLLLAV